MIGRHNDEVGEKMVMVGEGSVSALPPPSVPLGLGLAVGDHATVGPDKTTRQHGL
jgi:hypothetical protein